MSTSPPLAARMRPASLEELVGQSALVGPDGLLTRSLARGEPGSMLLWGPPGCGKTTLARLVAEHVQAHFIALSAVLSGIKDLRAVIERARVARDMEKKGTVLFVDEIHRWNKAQQDALLPHVEDGTIVLIGATTENPSFQVIAALRSRVEVLVLQPLEPGDVRELLERALEDSERGLGAHQVRVSPEVLDRLAQLSGGDARRALNLLERLVLDLPDGADLDAKAAGERLKRRDILYDRDGDAHYDVVSALIKSLRGSDPDASLYWLARMLEGGDDPVFIARRLVIFASEDVGNADPRGLVVATAAAQAVQLVGLPEGRINLAQAVTYLACAPKSNASYKGINAALAEVRRSGPLPVPLHLRNASTPLMKTQGYGEGYRYPHDHPHGVVRQAYLPAGLGPSQFYSPVDWGYEKTVRQRMAWWQAKLDGE